MPNTNDTFENGSTVPVDKSELPIKLPHDVDLKKAVTPWKIIGHGS